VLQRTPLEMPLEYNRKKQSSSLSVTCSIPNQA
jgi:hypothetical protein